MTDCQEAGQVRWAKGLLLAAFLATSAFAAHQAQAAATDDPAWCQPDCGGIVSDWSLTAYALMRPENGYVDPMAATRVLASTNRTWSIRSRAAGC